MKIDIKDYNHTCYFTSWFRGVKCVQRFIYNEHGSCRIYVEDKELDTFCPHIYLDDLIVDKEYRNQKYGSILVTEAIHSAQTSSYYNKFAENIFIRKKSSINCDLFFNKFNFIEVPGNNELLKYASK